jgi:hypothetical protein
MNLMRIHSIAARSSKIEERVISAMESNTGTGLSAALKMVN